jgi:formate/nitrite transporter FocA (FNT family)
MVHTGAFQSSVQDAFRAISHEVYSGSFGEICWRGFFGGWLIALTIWLIPTTEGGATAAVVMLLTYVVGLGGFSHIIAGSVDGLYAVFSGDATVADFLGRFFAPTLLGNIFGGVVIVSLLGFAQVKPDTTQRS